MEQKPLGRCLDCSHEVYPGEAARVIGFGPFKKVRHQGKCPTFADKMEAKGAAPEEEGVSVQVARLELEEGDHVVLCTPGHLDIDTAERIREDLMAVLPDGCKAIILEGGMTIERLTEEQREELLS